MELTRRRLVCAGSLATLGLAGCLDDGSVPASGAGNGDGDDENGSDGNGDGEDGADGNGDGGNGGNETDDGNGTEDGNESDGDDADDGSGDEENDGEDAAGDGESDANAATDHETLAYTTSTVPDTDADAFYDADRARSTLAVDDLPEADRERVESFVSETDFDRGVLVAVQTRGPNQCYELALEDAAIDGDGVTVRAAAVDGSESDEACGQAQQGLWLLVRLTTDGEVPNEGNITVVAADGAEHGIGYGRASDSAEAGGGPSSAGNATDDGNG